MYKVICLSNDISFIESVFQNANFEICGVVSNCTETVSKIRRFCEVLDIPFRCNGEFIIEDFLEFEGYHSSADYFSVDGKLVFSSFSDHLFDAEAKNPYTPSLIIWPTTLKKKYQNQLVDDIQKVFSLLNVKTGIYNIETCVAGGKPYIMEISPRGGGCKIAELQKLAYGVNLIEAEIKKAVGLPIEDIIQTDCDGYWCEMVVHSDDETGGVLKKIWIDPEIEKKYIKLKAISVEPGDKIEPFTGGNKALGDLIIRFDRREALDRIIKCRAEWLLIDFDSI